MGCAFSADGTSCSTLWGQCKSKHCESSCTKEARAIEDAVDEALKRFINDHLHDLLEAKLGKAMGEWIEAGLVKAIDIDIVPREPIEQEEVKVEEESALQ